eukprot:490406-Pleurochrysis_carterae.AAC.1
MLRLELGSPTESANLARGRDASVRLSAMAETSERSADASDARSSRTPEARSADACPIGALALVLLVKPGRLPAREVGV